VDTERDALAIADLTYDANGLIPAVVQQAGTGEVLMVAYMNAASLAKTVETGLTWFWSRSRQKYWQKGESSGHVQHVREIRYDCDADCLLVTVDQVGPGACHTGERSCFYRVLEGSVREGAPAAAPGAPSASSTPPTTAPTLGPVLAGLYEVLESRKAEMPEGSYTAKLLSGPEDALLKKIAEESGEVIMAAKDGDTDHLRYEIADLVYHLLVVMVRLGVTPDDLAAELDGRRK
jgi:phosphoribosyl-ATP pyrophosphohydrolase/phosphoribosyl-AMP cyclohydrolase